MSIIAIYPTEMKRPKGHYSPAVVHNDTVYVSGQLPIDLNGQVQLGSIEEQVELCLQNMEIILRAAGSDLQNVLKVNVFLADIDHWPRFNEVFSRIMGEHRPARIVVPCNTLNYGCGVEIDCIAAVARASEV